MKKLLIQSLRPILTAAFVFAFSASAQGLKRDCQGQSEEDEEGWAYCIFSTPGSQSKKVLYYFHGVMGDETYWEDGSNSELRLAIRSSWRDNQQDAPLVVGISFGGVWLAEGHDKKVLQGIAELLIPAIEAKIGFVPEERILMGASMGGFNATQLMMHYPQMWDRVALLSPLIPLCDPFLAEGALYMCISRDPYANNVYAAFQSHEMVKEFYSTKELWSSGNPLEAGRTLLGPQTPPLFISTGRADEFGFFTQSRKLSELARGQGVNVTWRATGFPHAVFSPKKVAGFLLNYTPIEED